MENSWIVKFKLIYLLYSFSFHIKMLVLDDVFFSSWSGLSLTIPRQGPLDLLLYGLYVVSAAMVLFEFDIGD